MYIAYMAYDRNILYFRVDLDLIFYKNINISFVYISNDRYKKGTNLF